MRLALIIPAEKGLTLIDRHRLFYHMALSQYVLSDPTYANLYQYLRGRGHFIMLDNGAAENGTSIGIVNVMAAVDMIGGVDEIVMPDVLDESRLTVQMTYAALSFVPPRQRAVVPHGRDWDSWTRCAYELISMGCRTICVAKRYEKLPGGRARALGIIADHGWHKTHDVHLLGCSSNPLREAEWAAKVAPWVRGIDTAAPISYAQAHASIDSPTWHSIDWDVPFGTGLASDNVKLMLGACQCT